MTHQIWHALRICDCLLAVKWELGVVKGILVGSGNCLPSPRWEAVPTADQRSQAVLTAKKSTQIVFLRNLLTQATNSKLMSRYKIHEGHLHFLTMTVVDWVDVFTRPVYAETVLNALAYCQREKGLMLYAYVIMPNHVHMLASGNGNSLSNILRDFKQFTSRRIVDQIKREPESRRTWMLKQFRQAANAGNRVKYFQFWQEGNHPIVCYSDKFILQKLNYIHQNPVKARLVYQPEAYVWSSASNYAGKRGEIDVTLLF